MIKEVFGLKGNDNIQKLRSTCDLEGTVCLAGQIWPRHSTSLRCYSFVFRISMKWINPLKTVYHSAWHAISNKKNANFLPVKIIIMVLLGGKEWFSGLYFPYPVIAWAGWYTPHRVIRSGIAEGLWLMTQKTWFSSIQFYSGKNSQIPKRLLHCGKHHKMEEIPKVWANYFFL